MRNKIQKSMLLVIFVTLVTSFSILMTVFYFVNLNSMKEEVKQETGDTRSRKPNLFSRQPAKRHK